MQNVTSYTYGRGSNGAAQANDLLTITEPDAQSGYSGPDADPGDDTVNDYNSTNEVTSQTDPMGWKTTFSYCVNAAADDCLDPATGTGLVTVTIRTATRLSTTTSRAPKPPRRSELERR